MVCEPASKTFCFINISSSPNQSKHRIAFLMQFPTSQSYELIRDLIPETGLVKYLLDRMVSNRIQNEN